MSEVWHISEGRDIKNLGRESDELKQSCKLTN